MSSRAKFYTVTTSKGETMTVTLNQASPFIIDTRRHQLSSTNPFARPGFVWPYPHPRAVRSEFPVHVQRGKGEPELRTARVDVVSSDGTIISLLPE